MKRFSYFAAAVIFIFTIAGVAKGADPFDPLFLITQFSGTCQVKTPDSDSFVAAVENKAYPYGTTVKTGRKSSAHIKFSRNNTCRLLANAIMEVAEDNANPKLKRLLLDVGKIEVSLDEELKETGNKLQVATPTAICGAVGTRFTVTVQVEQDLKIAAFLVKKGIIRVWSDHFNVPELGKDESASVSASRDMGFIRLRNLKGKYKVEIKDAKGEPKIVDAESGTTFKIYQRWSPDGESLLVTIVLVSPDGELQESITYSLDADGIKELPKEFLPGRPEEEEQPQEGTTTTTTTTTTTVTDGEVPVITTTTSTTTTTTTTTLPSVTPVGRF